MSYICDVCGKEYKNMSSLRRHTREQHSDDLNVVCELCGKRYATLGGLQRHLTSTHHMDVDDRLEYYDTYIKNDDEGHCKHCGKRLKLVKDRFSEGYMKFCYNSDCNVLWHNEHANRLEKSSEGIKKAIENNPSYLNSKIEYWIHKGYTKQEAEVQLSKRQSTFSKKICIDKYGEDEGITVFNKRQEKWLKSFPKMNYSKISQDLFWSIYDIIKDDYDDIYFATLVDGVRVDEGVNKEYRVNTNVTHRMLDFYILDNHKCIEFDGTYWHGEVGRGNRTRDEDRDKEIIDACPYISIYHVSEKDYNDDKEKVICQCLEFIRGDDG